jgi:hypothetical protein
MQLCSTENSKLDHVHAWSIQLYPTTVYPLVLCWVCYLAQGFTQVYVGDERSFKLGKLGPGQRFSFKIRVSSGNRHIAAAAAVRLWCRSNLLH